MLIVAGLRPRHGAHGIKCWLANEMGTPATAKNQWVYQILEVFDGTDTQRTMLCRISAPVRGFRGWSGDQATADNNNS